SLSTSMRSRRSCRAIRFSSSSRVKRAAKRPDLTEPKNRKGALAAHLTEPEKTVASGTATFVVGPYPARKVRVREEGGTNLRDPQARLGEAAGLARAIDLDGVEAFIVTLDDVRPSTYLGKGKVEELAGAIKPSDIGLVVMD